jgi:predicted DNA-binding ribbon-helix-helix protein
MASMHTYSSARRQQITVALEAPLKRTLEQMAQRDGRSLSNLIRKLIDKQVRVERSSNPA